MPCSRSTASARAPVVFAASTAAWTSSCDARPSSSTTSVTKRGGGVRSAGAMSPGTCHSMRSSSGAAGPRLRHGPANSTDALCGEQRPQHVLEDPAVAEVLGLLRRVDPHARLELDVAGAHVHRARELAGVERLGEAGDRELLLAGEPERLGALAVGELQRHDAHPDEVRAVDALEGLRDPRAHAEKVRAVPRPVARRARAVLLAAEHDER